MAEEVSHDRTPADVSIDEHVDHFSSPQSPEGGSEGVLIVDFVHLVKSSEITKDAREPGGPLAAGYSVNYGKHFRRDPRRNFPVTHVRNQNDEAPPFIKPFDHVLESLAVEVWFNRSFNTEEITDFHYQGSDIDKASLGNPHLFFPGKRVTIDTIEIVYRLLAPLGGEEIDSRTNQSAPPPDGGEFPLADGRQQLSCEGFH